MRVWKYALISGLLISIFLAMLGVSGNYGLSSIKYIKYLILIACLIAFYRRSKNNLSENPNLFTYIGSGAKITVIAATMVAITNLILFFIEPSYSIEKYSLLASTVGEAVSVSFLLFVELTVLGMLCCFVVYPWFKQKLLVPNVEDSEAYSNQS